MLVPRLSFSVLFFFSFLLIYFFLFYLCFGLPPLLSFLLSPLELRKLVSFYCTSVMLLGALCGRRGVRNRANCCYWLTYNDPVCSQSSLGLLGQANSLVSFVECGGKQPCLDHFFWISRTIFSVESKWENSLQNCFWCCREHAWEESAFRWYVRGVLTVQEK